MLERGTDLENAFIFHLGTRIAARQTETERRRAYRYRKRSSVVERLQRGRGSDKV